MQQSTEIDAPRWSAWHLHLGSTAQTAHDRVLVDVIGPALDEVPGKPWFFIRYWQGGPHLRLRLGDLDEEAFERVEHCLQNRMTTAARLTAEEPPVDAGEYARSAGRLAAGEHGIDSVVQELHSPGVYRARYVPEVERYGGPQFLGRSERLFQVSSELILALLPHLTKQHLRWLMALRATMSAATAFGASTEQAYFYARGLHSWREWAAEYGYPPEEVDQLCRITTDTGQVGSRVDPAEHGVLQRWHTAVRDFSHELRQETSLHPGQVVFSHVHMFHNRLGLSLQAELRTYAYLTHVFPLGENQEALDLDTG